MNYRALGLLIIVAAGSVLQAKPVIADSGQQMIERGKYLVQVGGCNDCHTPGYARNDGRVPVREWLLGSAVGFLGPWGVTYPKNLRIFFSELSEDQWVEKARKLVTRPPMPWFNLRAMQERDLRALYRFVDSLGVAGEPAPPFAAPGVAVTTPYIEFYPKNLPAMQARVK